MKLTKEKLRKLIQEELENLNVNEEEDLREQTLEAGGVQAHISGDSVMFSDSAARRGIEQRGASIAVPMELVVSVVEHATGVMLPKKGGYEPVEE
tara:strand:- start:509 stop:793 length:285 start_codon:yes stop_codon:yes gene_type:complete